MTAARATGGLRDVLPTAAALLGVPGAADRLALGDAVGSVRRVVVVLVDGMGADLLPLLAERAPLLASAAGDALRLHCGFPSTTPTSLVTLGTGTDPGEHGILGFTLAVPGTDRVLTHVTWRDDPDPRQWQPLPTWFEHVAAAGFTSRAVLPAAFAGSGLTDAAYRGAHIVPLEKGDDPAAMLLRQLDAGPGLYYGYTAALDTAAHGFGVASPQWLDAAAVVDAYLERIVAGLPDDAVLLVTADHGGLNLDRAQTLDVADHPELSDGVRMIAGEVRVRYVHTRTGATDDVAAAWRATLGSRADVRQRDDAIAAGWFGEVGDSNRDRLGDVIVVCHDRAGVFSSAHEPGVVTELVGVHGGLTEVETAIPLLAFAGSSRGSVSIAGRV